MLVHPTAPPGTAELDVMRYNLIASVGFMFDTSLAVARMIYDGFFDRYPNLKLIASHGGGALPYIAGRLDICFANMPACRERISAPPSSYLKRIYYDSVVFQQESLELALKVGGDGNVLYGSDYPHNIGDMKGCLARVDALPPAQRDAVRGGNAHADLHALTTLAAPLATVPRRACSPSARRSALRAALDPWLGARVPYITLFGAIIVAAWYGGPRPALLAAVAAWIAAQLLFVEPRGQINLRGASGPH